jgi:hypothetical protein
MHSGGYAMKDQDIDKVSSKEFRVFLRITTLVAIIGGGLTWAKTGDWVMGCLGGVAGVFIFLLIFGFALIARSEA